VCISGPGHEFSGFRVDPVLVKGDQVYPIKRI
jgi:hypothetical protein